MSKKKVQALKRLLTEEPVLKFFNPDKQVRISADAFQSGLGAVLLQQNGTAWQEP